MTGFTAPQGSEYNPVVHGYVPGSNPASEAYDIPLGSQANSDSTTDIEAPAVPHRTVFVNDYDPEYAFSNSPLTPEDRGVVALEDSAITEDPDFVIFPVETTP